MNKHIYILIYIIMCIYIYTYIYIWCTLIYHTSWGKWDHPYIYIYILLNVGWLRGLRCFWLYRFGGLCPQVTWNKRLTIRERGTVGRVIFGRKQSQNTVNTHVVCPWRLWNHLKPGRRKCWAFVLSWRAQNIDRHKKKVESSKKIQGPKCLAESWQNPQGSKRIKGP